MALTAYLDWAFPRKYDNGDRGVVYSCLFQNRYKRARPQPMFTLVVHDPPPEWVELELHRGRQDDHGEMWRIRGVFNFNYHQKEAGSIPVLHANPVLKEGIEPNAVFINCNNRKTPDRNFQYSIDLEAFPEEGLEVFAFVDNKGPFVVPSAEGKQTKHYSNRLIGVVPRETIILRTLISRKNGRPLSTTRFRINPETGRMENCEEDQRGDEG